MHIDFTKPTILTLQQYGTKVTIELDHSDTDIRELFDAFKSALIGQGYLMDTIEEYIKDIADELRENEPQPNYDDEYQDLRHSTDDKPHWDWDDANNYNFNDDELVWGSEEEEEDDLDIMMRESGFATDEDIEECELNEKGYKGIHIDNPHDETERNKRMDIIGQNGNEGLHYKNDGMEMKPTYDYDGMFNSEEVDEEVDWTWDEPNEKLKEAAEQYQKKMKAKPKTKKGKK